MRTSKPKNFNLLLAVGLVIIVFSSAFCNVNNITGNGHVVSKNFPVSNFKALEVSGNFDIELTQGNNESLQIDADDNLMKYIEAKVENNTLQIGTKENTSISYHSKLKVHLTYEHLNQIELSGSAKLQGLTALRSKDMTLKISGAADLNMDFFTQNLNIEGSGAGNFNLGGKTENFSLELSGAGQVDAYKLIAQKTKIEISGAASAKINTINTLDIQISGAGSVKFKGNPTVNKEISGIGSVSKEN